MSETRSVDVQGGLTMLHANFNEQQLELLLQTQHLLARGEPVPLQTLAEATGISASQVEAELDQHLSVERDESGSIVGWGLTLRPTPHKIVFDGRTFYGWCATDMLIFPVILVCPAGTRVRRGGRQTVSFWAGRCRVSARSPLS